MTVDLLVAGGSIVDGTGREPFRADVAISGDRIAWISPDSHGDSATRVVDATGRLVMPGFVDAHAHVDGSWNDPRVHEALLRQGVTTAVVGQDGLGYAPGSAEAVRKAARYFGVLDGAPHDALRGGASVAEFLDLVTGSCPFNVAALAPLGLIRTGVCGETESSTAEQLAAMTDRVRGAIRDGAVGVSSGLEYVPNLYSTIAELGEVTRPAAEAGLPHVTHMRGYELAAPAAFAEVLEVSRINGVPLHISHFRGPAEIVGTLADQAISGGIDFTFDSYPYLRGFTILAMRVLPPGFAGGRTADVLSALRDSATRDALAHGWASAGRLAELGDLLIGAADDPAWRWAEGRTVAECAAERGASVPQTILALLSETELAVSVITSPSEISGESDMRLLAKRPEHMAGSDGIYIGSSPHPRGWGAFARFLGQHVREFGDWTWGEAAEHLSANACRRFGLTDRGVLRANAFADVAIVDPQTVRDSSDYENPTGLALGVDDVIVAGELVLSAGALTGRLSGRGLRSRAAA